MPNHRFPLDFSYFLMISNNCLTKRWDFCGQGVNQRSYPSSDRLYDLTTIGAELAPTSGAYQVLNSSMRPLVVKLLFDFTCWLLLQLSIELAASLNLRLLSASNELLSVLASFCQAPNVVFAQGGSGKSRGTRGENQY